MPPEQLIVVYCVFIAAASLAGGKLPQLVRWTHARMQLLVSFVGGLMLGVGMFHLLPHAAQEMLSLDDVVFWTMTGLLATFFLIRAFHFHQHGSAEEQEPATGETVPGHAHSHEHDHDHDHDDHHPPHGHRLGWVGIGIGLGIHTLIDGSALAASVAAEAHGSPRPYLVGLGTFLAILLHKPLDSMSITSLMAAGGWSRGWRQAVNLVYAMLCPVGALLFWMGVRQAGSGQPAILGAALAFSAGVFLCISLGDLLPEVQFHTHDRFKLSLALLAGVALAWGLRFLEPAHRHSRSTPITSASTRRSVGQDRLHPTARRADDSRYDSARS